MRRVGRMPRMFDTKLHSKIAPASGYPGDQENSDGGVLLVRRSRADATPTDVGTRKLYE